MSNVDPAQVSLYIPVRNAARTLEAALDSVRAQRCQPAEFFLLVDTRSSDASVEIARRSGLRIVEQTEGRLGYARNLAIQACRTRWLASCDSDVTLEPDWLERLLARCGDDVAAVGGCTHECLITPADRWRAVNMPHNWGPLSFDNPFMLVSEMVADTDALRSIGGYRADLQAWEDSDACQRLRHAGYTLRYEPGAVAHHDRRDSVAGVLNLRWFYSAYRQRARLESLPGLMEKFAINRGYCVQSLSQTLHSAHPDVCAISVLLWFHHAGADLNAALGKWPLLTDPDRAACLERLEAATTSCLRGAWTGLRTPLYALLATGHDAPARAEAGSLPGLPGFRAYLEAAHETTREFLNEIPASVVPAIVQSAEGLAAGEDGWAFIPPQLAVSDADCDDLARQPHAVAWTWPDLSETLYATLGRLVLDLPAALVGLSDEIERPPQRAADSEPGGLTLVPHLETSGHPARTLHDALRYASVAVVAYQSPRIFVPSVPILTARDVASLCAAEGFEIRHFHTEAGLTRLIVARPGPVTRPPTRAGAAAGMFVTA